MLCILGHIGKSKDKVRTATYRETQAQQRSTVVTDVLTSTSSRRRSAAQQTDQYGFTEWTEEFIYT